MTGVSPLECLECARLWLYEDPPPSIARDVLVDLIAGASVKRADLNEKEVKAIK